jgi:hypothetical protein
MAIAGKLLTSAVTTALSHSDQFKPAMEPAAKFGKAAVKVLWGTAWKAALINFVIGAIWLVSFMVNYTTQNTLAMVEGSGLIWMGFLTMFVVPFTVFTIECIRIGRKLRKATDAEREALAAAAALEAAQMAEQAAQAPTDWTAYAPPVWSVPQNVVYPQTQELPQAQEVHN